MKRNLSHTAAALAVVVALSCGAAAVQAASTGAATGTTTAGGAAADSHASTAPAAPGAQGEGSSAAPGSPQSPMPAAPAMKSESGGGALTVPGAPAAATGIDTSPGQKGGQFITRQKASQVLGDSLIGMPVRNGTTADAKEIGKVTDLILNADHKLIGIVVGVGGFLGMGRKDVGIPWSEVGQVNPEAKTLQVKLTKEQLEGAPAFTTIEEQANDRHAARPPGSTGAPAHAAVGAAPAHASESTATR